MFVLYFHLYLSEGKDANGGRRFEPLALHPISYPLLQTCLANCPTRCTNTIQNTIHKYSAQIQCTTNKHFLPSAPEVPCQLSYSVFVSCSNTIHKKTIQYHNPQIHNTNKFEFKHISHTCLAETIQPQCCSRGNSTRMVVFQHTFPPCC